jgi:hypothetical protein
MGVEMVGVKNDMSEGEQTGLVPKYKTWLKRISTKIGLQVLIIRFTVTTRRYLRFPRRVWRDTTINQMPIQL